MILNIDSVRFSYDGIEVLKGVTFKAKCGEVIGIVGPNGCGKTTLLKCINNVLKPVKGTVYIDNNQVSGLTRKQIARQIGVVPQQSPASYPFTVLDFILMGREPYLKMCTNETGADLEVARQSMELTGILHLADRVINELSGGEFQRVTIARAFTQEPQVLLLDEPTAHLDVKHQMGVLQLLREVTEQEKLITVMVSHDLNTAIRFCDKLIFINRGRIVAAGKPAAVLTPDLIHSIYQINAEIFSHPGTGHLMVEYLPPFNSRTE